MTRVYLGIGSNVEPEFHVRAGVSALRQTFGEAVLSPVYRTAAVGFEGRDFLNLVAAIETDWPPGRLKVWLNDLEDRHGRRRDVPKFSDRNLDIDILLHGELIVHAGGLEIPRREILEFAHVLKPLADLAPDLVHPETGRRMAEHWHEFGPSPGLVDHAMDLSGDPSD